MWKKQLEMLAATSQQLPTNTLMAEIFPRHIQRHNSPAVRWCQNREREKKLFLCSANSSLLFPKHIFKFNAVGYRARFDFSRVSWPRRANVKVKLRWFNQLIAAFFFVFIFVCLYTVSRLSQWVAVFSFFSDGTWILFSFIGFARKEGRSARCCRFRFWFREQSAYNTVRAFKWRDIYRIIVKLVRCWSQALLHLTVCFHAAASKRNPKEWNVKWKKKSKSEE